MWSVMICDIHYRAISWKTSYIYIYIISSTQIRLNTLRITSTSGGHVLKFIPVINTQLLFNGKMTNYISFVHVLGMNNFTIFSSSARVQPYRQSQPQIKFHILKDNLCLMGVKIPMIWHIEVETNWPPSSWWHFKCIFLIEIIRISIIN